MVRGLDSLKRLSGATEEVADNADEASGALDGFTASTKKAGKEADRAGVDLEDAASKFRAMGESGTLAGDTLERFAVITSGPVGLAIGGLVVGAAAATDANERTLPDSRDIRAGPLGRDRLRQRRRNQ
jgi:hypothetical protein